ncbi:hypothetical protein ABFX02_12G142200 [Erythranthe guttata]|nr:PREDICTED: uncharacterized protein LOC105956671 [Erythranthe guttata]|eukprot:XP_012835997.1 PREDICTED: uncharacterized protein LOC105956671 [Erythranthe guttata]
MWQVLLAAAAAAGSGILAKKFINPTDTEKPSSDFNQNHQQCDQKKNLNPQDSNFQENGVAISDDGGKIFRFSSPQTGTKESKKKTGSGFRLLKKNGGAKRGNKNGGSKEMVVVDQRGNCSGKRVSVCLKKRRTGKHAAGNCESCASKDSSFGLGVGIGMMYVVSAGKAEISKLNCAMDETAKIVQELKSEISTRKNEHTSSIALNESGKNKKHIKRCYSDPLSPNPEVMEMDQLEAELESELQKLPWCATASSGSEGRPDFFEAEILAKEVKSDGVLPDELDTKLCHLLIEQQESQIVELEAELHNAHSKLHEKEAELEALKDCVKRLTEFSLASASDEEIEDKEEDVKARDGIEENVTESMVGMKQTIGY